MCETVVCGVSCGVQAGVYQKLTCSYKESNLNRLSKYFSQLVVNVAVPYFSHPVESLDKPQDWMKKQFAPKVFLEEFHNPVTVQWLCHSDVLLLNSPVN